MNTPCIMYRKKEAMDVVRKSLKALKGVGLKLITVQAETF